MKIRVVCTIALFLLTSQLITACNDISVGGDVSLQTYVLPLTVSINHRGEINFRVSAGVKIPTPIGVVSARAFAEPAKHYDVPNTLIVRFDDTDHIFDLHGQDFTLEIDSGYYESIDVKKEGKDLLLELRRIEGAGEGTITVPLYQHKRIETELATVNLIIEQLVITEETVEVHMELNLRWHNENSKSQSGGEMFLEDSCLQASGQSLLNFAETSTYSPIRTEMAIDTDDRCKGYVVFSRYVLKKDMAYTFCFACDSRLCSDELRLP